MKKLILGLLTLALAAVPACALESDESGALMNCMAVVVGKDASATGRVIVGHNEDDDGRLAVRHGYVKPATWAEGTALPAREGRAAIAQVPSTLGYFWSQVVGADGGLTGADVFLNDCGVLLVSNNNAESNANIYDDARLTDGGLDYNLRRIVAERATSAKNGLDIIIDLVKTWGYAPSGRAYTVADSEEAFMIQIVSGKHYVAARVPDDMVAVMPNHYTFHALDEYEQMYFCDDIVTFAIENGWYTPAVAGDFSDFDFAKAYQEMDSYMIPYNVLRQKNAMEMLLNRPWNEADGMPFAVKAEKHVTVEDVAAILSSHYEGTADDTERFGPGAAPHDTKIRRICTGTTIESLICAFGGEPLLTTVWTAPGRPCALPYLPLHPLCGTENGLAAIDDPAAAMANHFSPDPAALTYLDTGWQRMRDFQNALEMLYGEQIEGAAALKSSMMAQYAALDEDAQREAGAMMAQGARDAAIAHMNEADRFVTQSALERLADYASAHFAPVVIEPCAPVSRTAPTSPYTITFSCDGAPVEESLLFGMGGTNARLKYARPLEGSVKQVGEGRYEASFDPYLLLDSSAARTGAFDFILGGKTEAGTAFTGMTVLSFTE